MTIEVSQTADTEVERGKLADLRALHFEHRFKHQIDKVQVALKENNPQDITQANLEIEKLVEVELSPLNTAGETIPQAEQCVNQSLPCLSDKKDLNSKLDGIVQMSITAFAKTCESAAKGYNSIRTSQLGMFSHNFKSCNDANINDDIVSFLKKNIEFFVAPFLDQQKFAEWALGYNRLKKTPTDKPKLSNIQRLSKELLEALQCKINKNKTDKRDIFQTRSNKPLLLQFQEALLGENGQPNGLIHDKKERMQQLLINNQDLCYVIRRHMHNDAIEHWYADQNVVITSPSFTTLSRK